MTNKDWTDKLPDLLDGYEEAQPEGLWDAVQAGLALGAAPDASGAEPRRRHVIAAWWYAGGALLAAAAITAVFFLHRQSMVIVPSATTASLERQLITPENVPSSVKTPQIPDKTPSEVPPSVKMPEITDGTPEPAPSSVITPEITDGTTEPAPSSVITPEITDKTPEPAPSSVITPEITDGTPEPAPSSVKMPEITDGTTEPAPSSVKTPEITDGTTGIPRRVRSLKVQIGLSTTGYFGQIAMNTTAGVGFPESPGIRPGALQATKANSTTAATTTGVPKMLSRNKASTTDATHAQSLRTALGLAIDITDRWGVESGIVTSTLTSHFNTAAGDSREFTTRTMIYRGIPLYLRYNALNWQRFRLYLNAGPMYEYSARTSTNKDTYMGSKETGRDVDHTNIHDSIWSLNAGAGMQVRIFKHGALYVLPGVSYHFPSGSSVENFYTEHPLSFSVTFGYNFLF